MVCTGDSVMGGWEQSGDAKKPRNTLSGDTREYVHRRIPSMMEAWFSWSLITASSGVSSVSKIAALASKQLAYRILSCGV